MENQNYYNCISPENNFLDLKLYQYGWEKCAPLHTFGPAMRSHYLFHFIISGRGTLRIRNTGSQEQVFSVRENQGFLLCPDQIGTYIADEQEPWHYVWLEFDGLRATDAVEQTGLSADQPLYRTERTEQAEALRERMLYIIRHHNDPDLHQLGNLFLFLDQLIRYSASRRGHLEKKAADFHMQQAVGYIQSHYRQNLSVEEAANFCRMSRDQFTRRFKRAVGCTPQEYLIRLRLTTAANLLRSSDQPIKDVAEQCGYPNPLHFSQAFKKFYGASPREWRRKNTRTGDPG